MSDDNRVWMCKTPSNVVARLLQAAHSYMSSALEVRALVAGGTTPKMPRLAVRPAVTLNVVLNV